MIHPTAVIHPKAQLDPSVSVGPYAVIDEGVILGPNCWVGPHAYLTGNTTTGAGNRFFSGAVIGEAPQDLKYRGAPSKVRIGDNNTFRENVTVNRATFEGEETVIGSNNLLMAGSHIAHNCVIGNFTILANGALFAGHVVVEDRAVVSGNCCIHQFIHIGTLAMMQGGSAISKDLPPFCVARATNELCGLNIVGLRRASLTSAQRLELRKAYHAVFRGGRRLRDAAVAAKAEFPGEHAQRLLDFVIASKRGVVTEAVNRAGADADDEAQE